MITGSFTIIVPMYNEARNIRELVARVSRLRNMNFQDIYLILVDDGSTDDSPSILLDVSTHSWISHIRIDRQQGQHHAVIAGFRSALHAGRSGFLGTMDADMDPGPESFADLLPYTGDHDLIVARRVKRLRSPVRTVVTIILRFLCLILRPTRIQDHGSMFRVYSRDVVRCILTFSRHGTFIPGLSLLCARSPTEIPLNALQGTNRMSRYSLRRIVSTGWQMVRLIARYPFGKGISRFCRSDYSADSG